MKKLLLFIIPIILILSGCSNPSEDKQDSPPIVSSARNLIGIVTQYDTDYYQGGYPPADRGACTDVIDRALSANNYDLKSKIDTDMSINPDRYPDASDPNINFRRVRNLKIYFDQHAENLTMNTDLIEEWQPGDIVTYDQIPGSLWHIAIVSDKKNREGIPLLIHNYGSGVVEDDYLTRWPAPITGHYRLKEFST